jgi:hypothetical protein
MAQNKIMLGKETVGSANNIEILNDAQKLVLLRPDNTTEILYSCTYPDLSTQVRFNWSGWVSIECFGDGAGGGNYKSLSYQGAGGGGGGAYSKTNRYYIQAGELYEMYVGYGGTFDDAALGDGYGSFFKYHPSPGDPVLVCYASGGSRGLVGSAGVGGVGGAGGLASDGVGDVKYSGGRGENGQGGNTGCGGYGGGGASPNANGFSGGSTFTTAVFPSGSQPAGGGVGGNGGCDIHTGYQPAGVGGGAGGDSAQYYGTAPRGACGKIIIKQLL